jgi:hypothetical protein
MIRTAMAVVLTAAVLTACSSMSTASAPTVPAAISVPAGNTLAFALRGSGLLNYECRAKADSPGVFDWALASPDAVLKDRNDALVGKYYGGPTWEHADGSKVTGRQLAVAPAPTAGNIPWQLVQATPSRGAMTMNGISYVQRINTAGGVAPAEPCTAAVVASKKQVRYSADYLFYKG